MNYKKGMYLVISLFILWVIISAFWYACGIKDLCQTPEKVSREEDKREEIIEEEFFDDSFQTTSKIKIQCSAYLNGDLTSGEIVKLQYFLNEFEGADLVIDGSYGPATIEAVSEYQEDNWRNVGTTDGRLDDKTVYEINKDYCLYEYHNRKN